MNVHDGEEWTEMDIEDLKAAIQHCRSIQEVAEFMGVAIASTTSPANARS